MSYDFCRWGHPHDWCPDATTMLLQPGNCEPLPRRVVRVYAWCAHVSHLDLECGHWYGVPRLTRGGQLERRMYIGTTVQCRATHGPDGMYT